MPQCRLTPIPQLLLLHPDHHAHQRERARVQPRPPATRPATVEPLHWAQSILWVQTLSPLKGSHFRKNAKEESVSQDLLCVSGSQLTAEKLTSPAKGTGRKEEMLPSAPAGGPQDMGSPREDLRPDFICLGNLTAMKRTTWVGPYFRKFGDKHMPPKNPPSHTMQLQSQKQWK